MANYLLRYKGTYRVKCPYDMETNTFARKLDETLEDIDLYIPCAKGTQITHYGQSILQAWIPSAVRGRNTIADIEEKLGKGVVWDVKDNETEMLFKFHSKHMEAMAEFLKPQTGGCNISPFSNRNLPKASYEIPKEDLVKYSNITKEVPKTELFLIARATKTFIQNLDKKKGGYDKHVAEMKRLCVKGKEYIHKIGKWEDYINFLSKEL